MDDIAVTNSSDDPSELASRLAWIWVIEYVASLPDIDPSYVHGLIDVAPVSPDDLGMGFREMVSLRCLEHLFGSRIDAETNIPSAANPKVTFDSSKSCEDVLLTILKETSIPDRRAEPNLLKWDMQPFMGQKKSSMPKSSLERLKDALLEGSHPCVSSLMPFSGLMPKDGYKNHSSTDCLQRNDSCVSGRAGTSNTVAVPQEGSYNRHRRIGNHSHHRVLLPTKRNGNVLDNENQADYSKDQGDVGDDGHHLNAKRFKGNAETANETTETAEQQRLHAERESQVERLDKCVPSENGHEKFVSTDRIVRSADAEAINEIEQNQRDNAENATKMPQFEAGDGPCQDMEGTTNGAEIRNDTRDNNVIVENSEDSGEEEDTSSNGDDYHHRKVDVAMEKSQFLSSQCTLSHVSLSHFTELNLCVKCSKDGQLLVCNAVGCPMTVHEKCLGCSPKFDDKGNFYCPFCSYSYAISKYMEAKERAASARKELASFIRKDQGRSHGKKHQNNQSKKREVENKFKEPNVSSKDGNLTRIEKEPDRSHETVPVSCGVKESHGIAPEHQSVRASDKEIHVSQDPNINHANKLGRDKGIINEKECEGGVQKEVIGQQSNDLLDEAVCANNTDEGKTAIDEKAMEDKVSNYSLRFQRVKKECDEPVNHYWIKPRRVAWTAEEEEMLKEGVKMFSNVGEKMPWTRILEHGRSVFRRGRTAGDLKDKWRNMERKL